MEETNEKELSQDELKAIEGAAFAAEMSGDVVDVKAPDQQETDKPKQEAQEETQEQKSTEETQQQPSRVEVIPGWTQDELTQLREQVSTIPKLQKALDTTYGTYGKKLAELQGIIDKYSEQQKTADAKLSVAQLKRLGSEFPQVAELLSQDLNEIITTNSGQPASIDLEAYKQKLDSEFNDKISQVERNMALQLLRNKHSDYEVAAFSVDHQGMIHFNDMKFGTWLSQQPKNVQDVVLNSDDPNQLSKVLDSFKKDSAAKSPKDDDAQARIERSIQPKGVRSVSIGKSDKELEEEAYRAALSG